MIANCLRFGGRSVTGIKAGLICIATSTLLLAGASARANSIVNLVQNGDFSVNGGAGELNNNTTVADWTNNFVSGVSGYNFLFVPGQSEPSGEYGGVGLYTVTSGPTGGAFIAADADFQNGTISQTINGLKAGNTYDVTFEWAAGQQTGFYGPTEQRWEVTLGNETLNTPFYDLPGENANGPTVQNFSGWRSASLIFTADNSSEVLSFMANGDPQVPPFTLLDDVSLTATPEPETLPLLLTGLLVGAGLLKYRHRIKRSPVSAARV